MSLKKLFLIVITILLFFTGSLLYLSSDKFRNPFLNIFKKNVNKYDAPKTLIQKTFVKEESTIINAVEKVSPAVVSIVIKTYDFDFYTGPVQSENGVGTGFIVDSNGLIITNSHVVDDLAGKYAVVLNNGDTYDVNKVHLDSISDLAILEITARDLPVVDLGESSSIKVGQMAIAIGNALGKFQNSVTVGVVSGMARQLTAYSGLGESKTYENVIQTDAAINPGNSGGPLLNSEGQVIGINVATTYSADNISFAIPINELKPLLKVFIEKGRIVRPYIGVNYIIVTKEISQLRDIPQGAFVSAVISDTPAEKAGLKRGDIIVKIGDENVTSDNSLSKIISKKKVGDEINFSVDREGDILNFTIVLGESPEVN